MNSISNGAEDLSAPGRTRWLIGGLLGTGAFVNYVDRVNLSIAAQPLAHALNLDPSQLGIVFSSFLWTYALLQIPIGAFIDKVGVKWVMRIATVMWGVATFMTAAAGGLGLLIVARLILGVAETPMIPAAWKATGYWFPNSERGMCTSLLDGAAKLSNVIGIPAMAYVVNRWGWQAAFHLTGIVSVGYAVLFWALYRNPSEMRSRGLLRAVEHEFILEGGAQTERASENYRPTKISYLLTQRKTWGLALGYASYTYTYYVLLTWLPGFLAKQLGLNVLASGMYTTIPWIVAVIAEFVIGGWLVDQLIMRGKEATQVRRAVLVGSMVLSLAVVGAAFATSLQMALVFLSLGAAGLAITAPTASSIVALIAPQGSVAALGGIVNCIANLIGLSAPIVTGIVAQKTGSFSAAFFISGAVVVLGILSYIFLLGPIERIESAACSGIQ